MAHHGSAGTMQALYQIYVLPTLSHRTLGRRAQIISAAPSPNTVRSCNSGRRLFSSSVSRQVKTRAPEVRTERWNEEITSPFVYMVDPQTNNLYVDPVTKELPRPQTRYDVLSRLNLGEQRLVEVSQLEDGSAVCKIVNKKDAYAQERRKKAEAKDRKKAEATANSLKTLELNWAMDQNDLGHRLGRIAAFLAEGRKVDIILAAKKKGRKATEGECNEVLAKIRKTVDSVNGAKETKPMEGRLGGFVTLSFQGRMLQQQTAQSSVNSQEATPLS